MKVYIVTREGVYRHEIVGIYGALEAADARAQEVAKAEPDHWHEIQVSEAWMGKSIKDAERLFAWCNKASRGSGGGDEIERLA